MKAEVNMDDVALASGKVTGMVYVTGAILNRLTGVKQQLTVQASNAA